MASPSITSVERRADTNTSGPTGSSHSFATTDVIVVVIGTGNKGGSGITVSTVTSSTGDVFTLRKAATVTNNAIPMDLEVWVAPSGSSSARTVTVSLSGTAKICHWWLVKIANTFDITSAFDDDPSLPTSQADAAATPTALTYSTSEPDDLLFIPAIQGTTTGLPVGWTYPAGWSALGGGGAPTQGTNTSPFQTVWMDIYTKQVSAVQTAQTFDAWGATGYGIKFADAFTADEKLVLQTFVSCVVG